MSAFPVLPSGPWVERLGSTLLHFAWQAAVIGGFYAIARRCSHRLRPQARYLLACAALALIATAPLVTWMALAPAATEAVAATFTAPLSAGAPAVQTIPATVSTTSPAPPSSLFSWIVAVWIGGSLGFLARLCGGCILVAQLRWQGAITAPTECLRLLESLLARIAISRPVRLLVSTATQTPVVVGWIRPVVLLPIGALTGLPPAQLEALLIHELAHIRRHDYLVNVFQSIIESLLFYHPVVWWISGHIRLEREHCCDDLAVATTGDALTYARALSGLASAPPPAFGATLAANGGHLVQRVARLLGDSRPTPRNVSPSGAVAAFGVVAVAAVAVFAQSNAQPQFEAASIKPSTNPRLSVVRPHPGGLTADAGLKLLMQNAYGVQPFQIVGLPTWTDNEKYVIEARAAANAGRAEVFRMLQALLEDRFHLRVHRETKDLPVFALVAAKGGPKLTSPRDGACEPPPSDAPNDWAGGRMAPPGQNAPSLPRCGAVRISLEPAGVTMDGGKVYMAELTRMLSLAVGRTVLDRTGYPGLFDLKLRFSADEATPALPPPPPGAAPPADSAAPTIVTALHEQLGLRLESTRGPVDVIVVDHVEKPSAN